MTPIPNIVHFIFGLRPQQEPFHLLHYLAIESCRNILRPQKIYLYFHHLPFGVLWDEIRPHLELVHVDLVPVVSRAVYDPGQVPEAYRYAHHADFIRLDALIEHGGIYADIDTLFLRPLPEALFDERFVIGREQDLRDEATGTLKPSLGNAFLMSQPGAAFAVRWREEMASAMNGSWSQHSTVLPQALSQEMPGEVHVEPVESFYGVPYTPAGLAALLEDGPLDVEKSYSLHLWEHLWWSADRNDHSTRNAGDFGLSAIRDSTSPLAELARPFLPDLDIDDYRSVVP